MLHVDKLICGLYFLSPFIFVFLKSLITDRCVEYIRYYNWFLVVMQYKISFKSDALLIPCHNTIGRHHIHDNTLCALFYRSTEIEIASGFIRMGQISRTPVS